MNLIKRITTSVSATLEGAVGQLENHDAIIEANIKQIRQAVAKTQARLASLRQQLSAFENQQSIAREQINVWEQRAQSLAVIDEAKALQCLSRRNQNEAEAQRLESAIKQQHQLIVSVNSNLAVLKTKLDEVSQRHNLMRSRQAVADVSRVAAKSSNEQYMHDAFERWEASVLETELAISDTCCGDPLEAELGHQEHTQNLKTQLAKLTEEKPDQ